MSSRIIGKISGYHGLKGEMKIYPLLDDLDYFSSLEEIFIDDKAYKVSSHRLHKQFVLIKLENINSLTEAEMLKGYISAEIDEDLSDNEIYIDDLIGLEAYTEDSKLIGKVINYSDAGQKLISIKPVKEFSSKNEIMIPFVDEYIIEIANDKSYIKVKLTEDLLDLAL